jgi:hypothetical protein
MVYTVVAIGAAIGALQCYLHYNGVMLDQKPLCLVFEENFDNHVFGQSGTKGGSFMREVNMDGFGFVYRFSSIQLFPFLTMKYQKWRIRNDFVKDGHLYI